MKKLTAVLLALLLILSLCSCAKKEEAAPAEDTSADVEEEVIEEESDEEPKDYTIVSGKLTVATSPDFAPYEFYSINEDEEYVLSGFDPALAQYIADYLGLELDIIPMDFDGVLAELAAGNVDLGMAGLSPDPERADAMDFSDIYYKGGQSFVTNKDNADSFSDLESLNAVGKQIGAQNGSIQMDLANEYSADADIVSLVKVTDIVGELVAGTLDGAYIETVVAETYQKNYPELVIVCDVPYESEGSSVGVSKGNDVLLAKVNEAIAAANSDGSFAAFVAEANELAAGDIYEGVLD